jgi:hypothetical protein
MSPGVALCRASLHQTCTIAPNLTSDKLFNENGHFCDTPRHAATPYDIKRFITMASGTIWHNYHLALEIAPDLVSSIAADGD